MPFIGWVCVSTVAKYFAGLDLNEKMTDEECRNFVYKMADTKIEIAKLEREYADKYLKVLPPCKLRRVQHAEGMFQRDLMKKMTEHRPKEHDRNINEKR